MAGISAGVVVLRHPGGDEAVNPQSSVAVLGAGIGGLSAAHELVERSFAVTVYEKSHEPGGKAIESRRFAAEVRRIGEGWIGGAVRS